MDQALDTIVEEEDADGLEHIIVSMFDFHLDYQHATQLQGVKADYVSLARQALLKGDVSRLLYSIFTRPRNNV